MRQSSVIFAALLIGFVVYITIKGHLSAYAALLLGKTTGNTPSSASATSLAAPSTPTLSAANARSPNAWIGDLQAYLQNDPLSGILG